MTTNYQHDLAVERSLRLQADQLVEALQKENAELEADLAACAAGPWKQIVEYDGDEFQMILQRWRDGTTVLGLYGLRSEAVTHYAELREGPRT